MVTIIMGHKESIEPTYILCAQNLVYHLQLAQQELFLELRFRPARLCIYQLLLCLDQLFIEVCGSTLSFNQLFTTLPQYIALPLELGKRLLCFSLFYISCPLRSLKLSCLICNTLSKHVNGLGLMYSFIFESTVHLLNLGVQTVFQLL